MRRAWSPGGRFSQNLKWFDQVLGGSASPAVGARPHGYYEAGIPAGTSCCCGRRPYRATSASP